MIPLRHASSFVSSLPLKNPSQQPAPRPLHPVCCSAQPTQPSPPVLSRNPVLGLLVDLYRGHINARVRRSRHGPIYQCDFLTKPTVFVADVDAIATALRNPSLSVVGAHPPIFRALISEGWVLFLEGPSLQCARARLSPAFLPALQPHFFSLAHSSARDCWDSLSPGDPAMALSQHILRVLVNLTTGASVPADIFGEASNDDDGNEYISEHTLLQNVSSYYRLMSDRFTSLPGTPRRRRAFAARRDLINRLCELTRRRAAEQRASEQWLSVLLAEGNGKQSAAMKAAVKRGEIDMLSVLLATFEVPATDPSTEVLESVACDVLGVWFAGMSTMTDALVICLKELTSHPEAVRRLSEEQEKIPDLSYEAVMNGMPVMESFVMECLRLQSPGPLIFRRTTEDVSMLGKCIEKGSLVALDVATALREDTRLFEDRDTLVVDRFMGGQFNSAMNLAFGGVGSRHFCLGASLAKILTRTTLAVLLREFEIEVVPRTSTEYTMSGCVRPKDGLTVMNIRRK